MVKFWPSGLFEIVFIAGFSTRAEAPSIKFRILPIFENRNVFLKRLWPEFDTTLIGGHNPSDRGKSVNNCLSFL